VGECALRAQMHALRGAIRECPLLRQRVDGCATPWPVAGGRSEGRYAQNGTLGDTFVV
jgi:hypothetical protein